MNKAERKRVIAAAEEFAQATLAQNTNGHDWHHIERVRRMAVRIARAEKIDPFLPELMALLHDLHDRKVVGHGNEETALAKTRRWLEEQKMPVEMIDEVMYVIENQSYSASGIRGHKLTSAAGRVMQDADRLDALGAMGIARNLIYTGGRGNPLYDPALPPRQKKITSEEYKKDDDTAINHFYEKLLKLKDLMNTKTGRRLAKGRHEYMKKFLAEFFAEWKGTR